VPNKDIGSGTSPTSRVGERTKQVTGDPAKAPNIGTKADANAEQRDCRRTTICCAPSSTAGSIALPCSRSIDVFDGDGGVIDEEYRPRAPGRAASKTLMVLAEQRKARQRRKDRQRDESVMIRSERQLSEGDSRIIIRSVCGDHAFP